MTGINILRRLLFPLGCHLRRTFFSGHAARLQLLALQVVLGELRLSAVDWFFWHGSPLVLQLPGKDLRSFPTGLSTRLIFTKTTDRASQGIAKKLKASIRITPGFKA